MTGPTSKSRYVCKRCGVAVDLVRGVAGFSWKHCTGWRGPRSCGLKPVPVPRDPAVATAVRLREVQRG